MKVTTVKRARKSGKTRKCLRCGHEVQVGETYRSAEPRYGPIKIWCKDHHPKRSELTSTKLAAVYDAQDEFNPNVYASVDDLKEALNEIASVVSEVADEYQESIDAMPEGLQEGSPVAEDMREKVDVLQEYASSLEDWDPDDTGEDDDEDGLESAREQAQEAVNSCDV